MPLSTALLHLDGAPLPLLLSRLDGAGVRFNAYAQRIFAEGMAVGPSRSAHVEVHRLADLGFAEGARFDHLIAALPALGLAPCPLDAALHLRLAWPRVPLGPRITVVSPRWSPDELAPRGFYLRDDAEGAWLRAFVATDDWVAEPTEVVAVERVRRTQS